MSRLIFHDFDYVNPYSNVPEGDTIENVELRQQMLMQTSMTNSGFQMFGGSPGKSVYRSNDGDDALGFANRLGGVKTNLRALKNVKPMMKDQDFSPGMKKAMKDRFSSLEPKTKKWGSPGKLPHINRSNRQKQYGKVLKPLIHKKFRNNLPWIPSGNTSSVYTNKLSAFDGSARDYNTRRLPDMQF